MAVEIKICGLTRPVDVECASGLGVDRVGVVFAWGPRLVDPGLARELVAAAGTVPVLGVVSGGGTAKNLIDLARGVGLSGLQLHGESDSGVAEELRLASLEVWRVATLSGSESIAGVVRDAGIGADLVLLEPKVAGRSGGRGVELDLDLAQEATRISGRARIGLAGGLNPENVAEAIRVVGPDLVDVSSGVESAPGIKNPELLAHFVESVLNAHTLS